MILIYIMITAALCVSLSYNTIDKSSKGVVIFAWLCITALTLEGLLSPW